MPVLASDAFLDAVDASVGDGRRRAVRRDTKGRDRRLVPPFPTLAPETLRSSPICRSSSRAPLPPTSPPFSPPHGGLPRPTTASRGTARAAPFRSITVVSRSADEQAALNDPVAVGVIGALALGFVVAAIFAAAGFAANAAAEARSRRLELAVLRRSACAGAS